MSNCSICDAELEPNRNSRGLCEPCYGRERRSGRHEDHPRRTWSRDELMEEWAFLHSQKYTRKQAADRLGISPAALDRAIWRARAAGDPRAVPGDPGGINGAIRRAREAIRDSENRARSQQPGRTFTVPELECA